MITLTTKEDRNARKRRRIYSVRTLDGRHTLERFISQRDAMQCAPPLADCIGAGVSIYRGHIRIVEIVGAGVSL